MTEHPQRRLRQQIVDALDSDTTEHEMPPHPTDTTDEVKALAHQLVALPFGDPAQPLRFQTLTEYYQPLAQSILNAQAGWRIDDKTKTWIKVDAART